MNEYVEQTPPKVVSVDKMPPVSVDTTGLATEAKQDSIITAIGNIPGGGGVQYTEGDVDATLTGTVMMGENGADTVVPLQVDASGHLTVHQSSESIALPDGVSNTRNMQSNDAGDPIAHATFGYLFNGTTWDRQKGDASDGTLVNLGSNNDVTVTGTVTATATQLDIDNLNATDDVVTVTGGVGQTADVKVTLDGESVPVTGTFYQATQPVSIASAVPVTDNDGSLTVDGTVGVSGSVAVTGTFWQETQPVSGTVTAAAQPGVDIGDVTINNASIPVTGTFWQATQPVSGTFWQATQPVSMATQTPTLQAGTAAIGKLLPPDIDVTTHTNYARKYYTNAGAVTDGIIWSPAAGKRWHVVSLYINVSAACTVTLEDDKAGGDDPVWKSEFAANSGAFVNFPEKYPMASGEDAADLLITTSAGNVYVTVVGYEI